MNDNNEKKDKETGELLDEDGEPIDEEVAELMQDHEIDKDTAEKVQELIDEGLDEEDAIELADEL